MARSQIAVVILAVAAAMPGSARGQEPQTVPTRFEAGLEGAVAQPVGDFADEVNAAGGATIHAAYHLTPAVSLRVEGTFLVYGHEHRGVCGPSSCRISLDLNTNNQIVSGFIGPQLEVPTGPIRPYLRGGVGFGYFFTSSSLSGSSNAEPFASTNNYDDGAMALMGGAGLKVPFTVSRVPVAFDFGAQYQRNGDVSYLRKGSITDYADGSYSVSPINGPANFVQYHAGFSVTIPRSVGHHHH